MPIKGGSMKVSSLKTFIEATYNQAPDEILGYNLDKQLSTKYTKVYWDHINKRGITSERPTDPKEISDVLADVAIALDFTKKLFSKVHPRFKSSWATYDKVNKKYGLQNIVAIGYSLGSYVLSEYKNLSKFKEVILVALPVSPGDILTRKDLSNLNITTVKSKLDAVGFLDKFVKGFKREVSIKPETNNPFKEHQISNTLPRLDQDMQVGDTDILTGLGIHSLTVPEIKALIKKLRIKRAKDFPIAKKNKGQLLQMLIVLLNDYHIKQKPQQKPVKRIRKPRKRLIEEI